RTIPHICKPRRIGQGAFARPVTEQWRARRSRSSPESGANKRAGKAMETGATRMSSASQTIETIAEERVGNQLAPVRMAGAAWQVLLAIVAAIAAFFTSEAQAQSAVATSAPMPGGGARQRGICSSK